MTEIAVKRRGGLYSISRGQQATDTVRFDRSGSTISDFFRIPGGLARALLRIQSSHPTPTECQAMISSIATMSVNPLFLRHDLMIELGRLEMAMQDMRDTSALDLATSQIQQLETRRARINEALSRLPA
ncbi:MAG TPA: hypothetical protein PLF10_07655 [Dokdonella sp.]|nr:hypothetical protein [Dokdonella sp.]